MPLRLRSPIVVENGPRLLALLNLLLIMFDSNGEVDWLDPDMVKGQWMPPPPPPPFKTARTAVHAAAARAGAACGARDRGLLARSHHRLAVRTDVAEGVAHPHLDRLVVRHELQLARRLDALVDVVTEQALQFRIQQLPDHQDLDDRCALVQSLDELTSLVDLFDRFLAFLRGHAKRYLLGREDALQLFEQLLLALLQHRPVEHERVVDLVLSLVVLHLEAAGHVLDVLQDVAYVGGFGLGFLHSVLDRLDLLGGGLADMFVFVYAGGVFQIETLLADGDRAGATEVLEQFALVPGTHRVLLAVGDEAVLGFVLDFGQVDDSVALEAVHELVSHDAVGAQVVGTVDAAGDGV
jgi:hypothetical protein